jgi:hypothetical protein
MLKRQTVCPHVEPVESRLVLSVIGIHAHPESAVAAHVSQRHSHDEGLRADLSAIDHARRVHERARLIIAIAHPRRTSVSSSTSSSTSTGLNGLFKSFLSSF